MGFDPNTVVSMFYPFHAGSWESALKKAREARYGYESITDEKFSGNSKQRRKQFRRRASMGYVSFYRHGEFVPIKRQP
jgi:hypothetical protein